MTRVIQHINEWGVVLFTSDTEKLSKMLVPVKCNHCGQAYDLCGTKVLHRYMDCTEYLSPCCNKRVDDREWVSFPAFTRLNKDGTEQKR